MTTKTLLDRLTDSVTSLRNAPLTPEIAAKAQVCLLDYFAAACAGTATPTAGAGVAAVRNFGGGACTLIGLGGSAAPAAAALYNGLLGHAEELDDSHRYASGLHQAATVIPAALALAETGDLPGESVLRAIVCGYEAAGRIARCIDKEHRARGFHATGTLGPFGAAAASAVLLNLGRDGFANALGIAASASAGIFAFLENGASVKHFHAGRPALDGIMAASLAMGGMTAPATVLEAREGFFRAYASSSTDEFLDADLGAPEIMHVYHKIHSACGHSFPAIDAALALRGMLEHAGLEPADLMDVTFKTYGPAAVLKNPAPKTVQEARFSVPFVFALALVKGRVSRAELTPESLRDPVLLDLCRKVRVFEDPAIHKDFPRLRAGEMWAETACGQRFFHRVDSPLGMPDNPVTLDVLEEKFRTEASAARFGPETIDAVLRLMSDVGHARSIRPLMACFRR